MKLWCTSVLMVLLVGCGTASRVVRLDTGRTDTLVFTPRSGAEPVELDDGEFEEAVAKLARDARSSTRPQEAARRLFEVAARSGSYTYETRSHRITPHGSDEHLEGESTAAEVELTRDYLRWCGRTGRPGDCLRLLTESPTVNGDGRFALAMALAKGAVLDEMLEAFKDMADPHAMVSAVLWTWTTYMVLISIPDVTISKGLAAVMTATLISYVGVDTFWGFVVGFKRLMDEADRATTFYELREAGERYGKVMGRNAARAFAMLATAALGNTAPGLAAKVPTLPGAMQAAVQAETQMGIRLAAVGEVETVAVNAEAVTIALVPGAVAMTARAQSGTAAKAPPNGFRAWGSYSGFKRAKGSAGPGNEWHHIVEQTPGNVERFGAEAVHNTENVVPLDKGIHTRLSSLYSSIQRDITGSSTLTVRQWLSTQSYEAQRKFGLIAIEKVTKGFW
ncbi:MAG: SitA5 family polymorphic toxin [Archangium sp.]